MFVFHLFVSLFICFSFVCFLVCLFVLYLLVFVLAFVFLLHGSAIKVLSQASKDHLVVKKGEQGKLCGTGSGLNPLSSCKGSGLKDDIEVTFCC